MRHAGSRQIGDARCELLAKNLPGLTKLNIRNNPSYLVNNNLSDIAMRSVSQLRRLTELNISTQTLILDRNTISDQATELIATLPSLVALSISTVGNNLGNTKITRKALVTLCRLKLSFLNISKVISYID